MKTTDTLTVGIVANEFFDPDLGRMGGYGWAAQRAAQVLKSNPNFNPVFLTSKLWHLRDETLPIESNGIPLYLLHGRRLRNAFDLFKIDVDLFFTIDYRPSYNPVLNAWPFIPIITWVRDPRTPSDIDKMMSLQIPGAEDTTPQGVRDNDTHRLAEITQRSWPFNDTVVLANKMPHMCAKDRPTYHLPPSPHVLPNPSLADYSSLTVSENSTPTVLFLGRLDPIKRPWLYLELARQFPEVQFLMAGQKHFDGDGAWTPDSVPNNVELIGHVMGAKKWEVLSKSWALVNTSIHEESPVSVLEALAFETPILTYEDWGGLAERFGSAIGQHRGDGTAGIPKLCSKLDEMLSSPRYRRKLGEEGRSYVENTHNDREFISSFVKICKSFS